MKRKIVSIALFVSFVALATSGMLMFIVEKPSFTIQMHPVHKVFGLVMTLAGLFHLLLNMKPIIAYLREKPVKQFAMILFIIMIIAYGVSILHKLPDHIAVQIDSLATKPER